MPSRPTPYADPEQQAGGELDEHDLAATISSEISESTEYDQSFLSDKRRRAIEYYRGEMTDTPPRTHGSRVTSRDLADTMSWILPGIMRTFMASDRMAEFEATASQLEDPEAVEQAEEQAEQATDYISHIFMKDADGYSIVHDATYNSLQTGDAIIKHWFDPTPITSITHHTGMTAQMLAELTEGDEVEILTQEDGEPLQTQDPLTGELIEEQTWNVKAERVTMNGQIRCRVVAPENFLIDNAAIELKDYRFCAERDPYTTRSALVEMGFDRDKVEDLSADANTLMDSEEAYARRHDATLLTNSQIRSQERIDLYECYLQMDADGDGISETIRVFYAGDSGAGTVLEYEVWEDELPFSKVPCYPQPHRFDSHGIGDRTVDIQQIKTILLRQMLDNQYASNMPQREIEIGSVLNPDAIVSPKFGGVIWKKKGSAQIIPHEIPNTAAQSYPMLEYLDRVSQKRTGVTDQSMSLDPEALQNQSATANQNAHDASYSQIELIARNMAELGWRNVFRAILKLVIKHQDRPRIIRLRGEFISMDPRSWNADMDCTVNVGLGTGSRDRDMVMLQGVMGNQMMIMDRLSKGGFTRKAMEMIPKLRLSLIRIAESAGLRNPDAYYLDFDDQDVEEMVAQAEQQGQQPPLEVQVEQVRGQVAVQAKQVDAELAREAEVMKAQGNQVKEAAQLEADMTTKAADREKEMAIAELERETKREEIAANIAINEERLKTQYLIEQLKLGQRGQEAEMKNTPNIATASVADAANALTMAADRLASAASRKRRTMALRDENGTLIGAEDVDEPTPETVQ